MEAAIRDYYQALFLFGLRDALEKCRIELAPSVLDAPFAFNVFRYVATNFSRLARLARGTMRAKSRPIAKQYECGSATTYSSISCLRRSPLVCVLVGSFPMVSISKGQTRSNPPCLFHEKNLVSNIADLFAESVFVSSRFNRLICFSISNSSGESGGFPLINRSVVTRPRACSRTENALAVSFKCLLPRQNVRCRPRS